MADITPDRAEVAAYVARMTERHGLARHCEDDRVLAMVAARITAVLAFPPGRGGNNTRRRPNPDDNSVARATNPSHATSSSPSSPSPVPSRPAPRGRGRGHSCTAV